MTYEIAISKIPLKKTFFYSSDWELEPGERVLVDFNNRQTVGYVVGLTEPHCGTKPVLERLDGLSFLPTGMIEMVRWASQHFYSPMGQLFDLVIPSFVDEYTEVVVEPTTDLLGLKSLKLKDFLSVYGEETLDTYLKKGLVKLHRFVAMKTPRRRYRDLFVMLNIPLSKAVSLAKKAEEFDVVNYLFSAEGATIERLIEATGVNVERLKKMEEKGLIRFTTVPLFQGFEIKANDLSIPAGQNCGELLVVGGSTEERFRSIYSALKGIIEEGKSVLYMVPLSSQVPYVMGMIQRSFTADVYAYHGNQLKSQRALAWFNAQKSGAKVFVTTRMGVFLPVRNLGAVVVESDEDESYYQFDEPVYDAVEMARRRAQESRIPIILSSATGRVSDYFNLDRSRIIKIKSERRKIFVIDMRKQTTFVSQELLDQIRSNLEKGNGVLIVVRRKGYAPFVICAVCGHILICPKCDVSLSFHRHANLYKCHQCGHIEPAKDICPKCGAQALYPKGYGTERIEKIIRYNFPSARIARIDSDEMNHSQILDRLLEFERGDLDILVGTRVLLHGFGISRIGLIAFLDFDGLLFQPDYNFRVQVFQQLNQGIEMAKGATMVLQTMEVENEVVKHLFTSDTEEFYLKELQKRRDVGYPPYVDLVQVVLESEEPSLGWEIISSCTSSLDGEEIFGPVEHPVFKLRGKYRFHFLIKTKTLERTLSKLDDVLTKLGKKGWRVLVNPPHLW